MGRTDPRSAALNPRTQELTLVPFSFWWQQGSPTADPGAEPRVSDQSVPSCRDSASSPADPSGGAQSPRLLEHDRPGTFWPATDQAGGPPLTLAELQQAMAAQLEALGHPGAEPLRWAITGTDPVRGLRLEGIGLNRTADRPDKSRGPAATPDPVPLDPQLGPTGPHT